MASIAVMLFFVMAIRMATAPVIVAVVASVIALTGEAIIGIAFIAQVIAQRAPGAPASG